MARITLKFLNNCVLHQGATFISTCPIALQGASKRFGQKDQEIKVARIGRAKSMLWTYDSQYNKQSFFFLGQVKMSLRYNMCDFIKFLLYLHKWAPSGDKNINVAPWLHLLDINTFSTRPHQNVV